MLCDKDTANDKGTVKHLDSFVDAVIKKRIMLCIGAVKSHVTRTGHVTAL